MKVPNSIEKYVRNSSWLLVEKVFRMLVGFSVGVWVARYLGPERLGIFTYAQSFVFLFSAFATLGLDGIVVRELVKFPNKRDVILGTSLVLKLSGAFITLSFLGAAVALSGTEAHASKIIMLIGVATVFQAFNVVDFYFQSRVLSKYVVFTNSFTMLLISCFKIFLILNDAPLIWFAGAVVIESLLIAAGLLIFYVQKSSSLYSWTADRAVAKELLKDSWPLIIGSLGATIYMKIDVIIIEKLLDSASVGIYSIAIKLSEVWLFATVIVTSSFAPSITASKSNNELRYIQKLQLLYNLLVKIAVLIAMLVFVFAPLLVLNLYGEDYRESISVLQVYIWAIIFVFLSNGSWSYYLNEGLEKLASLRLILGAIINIGLNFIFIPKFGLVGAAYATLISYAFSSFFFNCLTRSTLINFKLQLRALRNVFNIKSWLSPLQIKDLP